MTGIDKLVDLLEEQGSRGPVSGSVDLTVVDGNCEYVLDGEESSAEHTGILATYVVGVTLTCMSKDYKLPTGVGQVYYELNKSYYWEHTGSDCWDEFIRFAKDPAEGSLAVNDTDTDFYINHALYPLPEVSSEWLGNLYQELEDLVWERFKADLKSCIPVPKKED